METSGVATVATDSIPASFLEDPVVFLSDIVNKPPSLQALDQLGGWMATWFANKAPDKESSVAPAAAAYLQAAAVHLQEFAFPTGNAHLEAATTKKQYEVVTTVGICASLCKDRRGAITRSGILPSLADLFLNSPTHHVNQLSLVGVEFLQCAMLAEQYRYAARMVGGTWPRPDMTVNVKLVLRYYYLRGMIHLGCNDFVMAHRCFWTCLTIPAEVCCKIAVEAWKKMILVQCIMNDGSDPKSNQISLPKSIPTCLARMLPSCKESTKTSPTATNPRVSHGPQPSGGLFPPARPLMSQAQSQSQSSNEIAVDTESTLCYMNIAVAFYGRKRSKLQALMEEHKSTIEGDGNCGLLQQCLTQLINNQVRHISRMYSVVSISKAATLLGISGVSDDATNQHVAALLCQSGIPCEIQEDGMIVFSDLSDQSTETSSLMELTEWMALIEKVQRLDVSILTTPRYQSLIRKDVSIGASGEGKVPNTMSSGPRGVDDL